MSIPTLSPISPEDSRDEQTLTMMSTLSHELASMVGAFQCAPIGLCVLDLDFRYILVNTAFTTMYNLTEKELIGRSVEEALPEPASQIISHMLEALRCGGIVEKEISLQNPRRSDVDRLIFLRTAQPLTSSEGNIIGVSVALLDITHRKRSEAALKETEDNLRYTVELTPHIPWTADPTGELTSMSPRWNNLTGRKEEVLLKSWSAVLHPDDLLETAGKWAHSVGTGEPYDAEYRIVSADQSWRWVRARAYPRFDEFGKVLRWYGTVEDVHERKETDLRLQLLTETLAKRAKEDHLTGLANRRQFDDVLFLEIGRARRNQRPVVLILFDVDHFKSYNDQYGHLAGDECLRAVAHALGALIRRPADLAARFGGEEFAIILPETSVEGGAEIAQRAVMIIRSMEFPLSELLRSRVTISAGVSHYAPDKCSDVQVCVTTLIKEADVALYRAKAAGRNCVVRYDANGS